MVIPNEEIEIFVLKKFTIANVPRLINFNVLNFFYGEKHLKTTSKLLFSLRNTLDFFTTNKTKAKHDRRNSVS